MQSRVSGVTLRISETLTTSIGRRAAVRAGGGLDVRRQGGHLELRCEMASR